MASPSVSVVMPAFNAERYLAQTIDSVLRQSLEEWELLVIDDQSTDSTSSLVSEHARRDGRIRLLENPSRGGPSAARNRGIDAAQGRYVAFLDADDLISKNALASHRAALERDPLATGSYCRQQYVDAAGRRLGSRQRLPSVVGFTDLADNKFAPSAVTLRLEPETPRPQFDPQLTHGEDWDLWLRLARRGRRFVLAQDGTVYRRLHGESLARGDMPKDFRQRMLVLDWAWQRDPRVPDALPAFEDGLAGAIPNEARAQRAWAYVLGSVLAGELENARALWDEVDFELVALMPEEKLYPLARGWCLYTMAARGSSWPRLEADLARNLIGFTQTHLQGEDSLSRHWQRLSRKAPMARQRRVLSWLEWMYERVLNVRKL